MTVPRFDNHRVHRLVLNRSLPCILLWGCSGSWYSSSHSNCPASGSLQQFLPVLGEKSMGSGQKRYWANSLAESEPQSNRGCAKRTWKYMTCRLTCAQWSGLYRTPTSHRYPPMLFTHYTPALLSLCMDGCCSNQHGKAWRDLIRLQ